MSATLTIIPDPKTATLYIDQMLRVTVHVQTTVKGTITKAQGVQLTGIGSGSGSGFRFNTFDTRVHYDQSQPITISEDGLSGTATFILDVMPTTETDNATDLSFTAQMTGPSIGAPPVFADYKNLAARLYPFVSNPSQLWLPIPQGTVPVPLLPTYDAGTYTTYFTATVTDSNGQPVENYVIDWHEAHVGDLYQNLLLAQMYSYLNLTDTEALEALDTKDLGTVCQATDQTFFIRGVTGPNGIASLYLVVNTGNPKGGKAAGYLDIWLWHTGATPKGQFLVINLNALPDVTLLPKIPPLDPEGKLLYPSITGPNVPVEIDLATEDGAEEGDPVYIFINSVLGDVNSWWPEYPNAFNFEFPKLLGNTDTGETKTDQNTLQFVWLSQSEGSINLGSTTTFAGSGSRTDNSNPPVPPTVLAPLLTAGGYITTQLAERPISFTVLLNQLNWPPQPGDQITLTANLIGYDKFHSPRKGFVFSPPYSVNSYDISLGEALITLDQKPFIGWDYGADTNTQQSYAYVSYEVYRPSSNQYWLSQILTEFMFTIH